nr:MAG TPA: CpXC protein [Caudoviricetes sp.]
MSKRIDYDFETCDCECDNCGETTIVDSTDFKYVNDELKEKGWKVAYINDSFNDFCCEECYKKFVRPDYNPRKEV